MDKDAERTIEHIHAFARDFTAALLIANKDGIGKDQLLEVALSILYALADGLDKEDDIIGFLPKLTFLLRNSSECKRRSREKDPWSGLLEKIDVDSMPRT